jgi:hypothetical protein
MPGAPHMRMGKPIAERSTAGIIFLFMVLPILAGVIILCFTTVNALARGREFTAGDWFWQVGWFGLLGLGLLLGLPASGWKELRRRKQPPAHER